CSHFYPTCSATTDTYTLSLHDALPICVGIVLVRRPRRLRPQRLQGCPCRGRASGHFVARLVLFHRHLVRPCRECRPRNPHVQRRDRKSTRLNSSHLGISYAVFCLKKKK